MTVVFRPSRLLKEDEWDSLGAALLAYSTPKTPDYFAADLFGGGRKKLTDDEVRKMREMKLKDLSFEHQETDDSHRIMVVSDGTHELVFSDAIQQEVGKQEMRGDKLKETLRSYQAEDPELSIYDVLTTLVSKEISNQSFEASLQGQWLLYLFGNPSPLYAETEERKSKIHPSFKPLMLLAISQVVSTLKTTDDEEALDTLFNVPRAEDKISKKVVADRLRRAFDKAFIDKRHSLPRDILGLIGAEEDALTREQRPTQELSAFDEAHQAPKQWYLRRKSNLLGMGLSVAVMTFCLIAAIVLSVNPIGAGIVGLIGLAIGVGAIMDFVDKEKKYTRDGDTRRGIFNYVQTSKKQRLEKQGQLDKAMIVEPVPLKSSPSSASLNSDFFNKTDKPAKMVPDNLADDTQEDTEGLFL